MPKRNPIVQAKICGLTSRAAVEAALAGGAAYLGFVSYPPSPRSLSADAAAALACLAPAGVQTVAVVVDPSDDELTALLAAHPFDVLQLHGRETPERVAAVAARFRRPVMKAVPVAGPEDITSARAYEQVADLLLFDAKPPKSMAGALPGGNGLAFDWELLAARAPSATPWMLSGGLDVATLAVAVATSGARMVDVSSGVEDRPGEKSVEKIRAFLAAVKNL